jgi:NAD(P)-dependent dehydrogenase (short-subunit alcohol dehydrogenase family)
VSVLESFSLKGKVAVVTGGGGLYGVQITEALAEAGARTFIASRDVERLERRAADLRLRGLDVHAIPLDQSREESAHELLRSIQQSCDGVDVLVNNAVLRTMRDWTSPASDFTRSMEVNATGMFVMTRTFGDHMASRGRGSIINIGSIQGMVGPDFTLYEGLDWGAPPDYFFHKGGLLQLTRFAAAKLGSRGVRVNCLSPGGFFTEQDDRFVQRYNARTFLNRMANESDLQGAIVFLASDASAYITAANIPIDGGYTAK